MSENQKKIWITGASSGIGKAVAEKFANEGWKVAVSARRKELLDELAKHDNISSFPLDVTNESQINNVFKDILNAFGDIDICLFSIFNYYCIFTYQIYSTYVTIKIYSYPRPI